MSINSEDAFDIREEGLVIVDNNDEPTLYITSGTGDPTGTPAPVNTWVFDKDTQKIYRKIGAGNNDWEEFIAAVAQAVEIEAYADNPVSSTTSNDWVDKLIATTISKPAGTYLILHSSQVTNSNNSKVVGYRAQYKPSSSGTWIDLVDVLRTIPRGEEFDPVTGINIITLASADTIDLRTQFGQTTGGGTGRIQFSDIAVVKVEDLS